MTQKAFSFIGAIHPQNNYNSYEINIDFNDWNFNCLTVEKIQIILLKEPFIKTELKEVSVCPPITEQRFVYGSPRTRDIDFTMGKLDKIKAVV